MLENFELCMDNYIYELNNEPNLNEIIDYFKNESFEINSLSDFTNSIKIMILISTVQENLEDLKENLNEDYLNLIFSYGLPENEWKISTKIKAYINKNLKEIFKTEDGVLIERTLDLICKYGTTIDNFEYIVNDFMNTHQVYFFKQKEFYTVISKNCKTLKKIYVEKLLMPIDPYHLSYQLLFLDNYKGNYPEIKIKFEQSLLDFLQSNKFKTENILLKKQIINIIFKSNISTDVKLNLETLYKSIELDLKKEVKNNGKSTIISGDISYYINLVEGVEDIRDKMFYLDYHWIENKLISTYSYISTIKEPIFYNLISNLSNNTNHSNSFVNLMNLLRIDSSYKVNYLLCEFKDLFWEELEQLYKDVLNILDINEHRNFVKDLKKLFSIELYEVCCSKIVREIEYLLRCIYINKKFGVNISGSKHVFIGLSDIFSEKTFSNLFSEEDIKCLKYILIEDTGFNYRNSICHNNIDILEIYDALYLLSIFIFLLVSVDYLDF